MSIEKVQAQVILEVDDASMRKAWEKTKLFARDTKKELDKSFLFKLQLDKAKTKLELEKARKLLRQAKKDWDKAMTLRMTLKTDQLQSKLSQASWALRNFENKWKTSVSRLKGMFNSLGASIKKIGLQLLAVFAIDQLARFAAKSVRVFADFEKGLARINTVANVSQKEMKGLWNDIKKVSEAYGLAKDELLDTAFNISSAWVEFENVSKILQLSAQVAVGAWTDTTTAFNGIIAVIKKYGENLSEAWNIAEKFFIANKLWQTTIWEMASAMTNLTSTVKFSWISIDQLFATYSALTGVTGTANTVTTQLNGAINALVAPTKEASAKMKELWLEITADTIAEKGLAQVSRELWDATGQNLEVLRRLIPEVEATKLVVALATTQYDKFNESTKQLTEWQGNLEEAMRKMQKTTAFELAVAWQKWDNFMTFVWGVLVRVWWMFADFANLVWGVFQVIWWVVTNWINVALSGFAILVAWLWDVVMNFKEFAKAIPNLVKKAMNALPQIMTKGIKWMMSAIPWGDALIDKMWLKDFSWKLFDVKENSFNFDFKLSKKVWAHFVKENDKNTAKIVKGWDRIKDTVTWNAKVKEKVTNDFLKWVEQQFWSTTDNIIKDDNTSTWNSIENIKKLEKEKEKAEKEEIKRLEDRAKSLEKWAELIEDYYWTIRDEVEKSEEKIDDFDEKIADSQTKIRELKAEISGEREELWNTLLERKLEIEKEIAELRKDWLTHDEHTQRRKLQEELRLIEENKKFITEDIENKASENTTETALRIYNEKRALILQEINDEREKRDAFRDWKLEEREILKWLNEYRTTLEHNYTSVIQSEVQKRIWMLEKMRQKAIATARAMERAWITTNNTSITNLDWVNISVNGAGDPLTSAKIIENTFVEKIDHSKKWVNE